MPFDENGKDIVGDLENAIHSRQTTHTDYPYFVMLGEMTLISRGHVPMAYPT